MGDKSAIIVGVGEGLSASLARRLAAEGYDLNLVARDIDKLENLKDATGATLFRADGTDADAIRSVVEAVESPLRVAIYNPSYRVKGPVTEIAVDDVRKAVDVTAVGSFILAQAAARAMLNNTDHDGRKGTILFTGASAGVKGFAQSAPFAMGKFAQRGLAQSLARELHPKGIHVAWVNIDGAIRNPGRSENEPDSMLDPDALAQTYLGLIAQDRSTWSDEVTVRPWVETF